MTNYDSTVGIIYGELMSIYVDKKIGKSPNRTIAA
jgi:hypothetical protein